MHDMAKTKLFLGSVNLKQDAAQRCMPIMHNKLIFSEVTCFDEIEIWVMFDLSPASQHATNLSGDHRNSVKNEHQIWIQ